MADSEQHGRLVLSDKYKAFLRCEAPVEFLEGTTAAGKTTVGICSSLCCKVAQSHRRKLHILAADDTGAAEKNISSTKTLASWTISEAWQSTTAIRHPEDDKMPHILFHTFGRGQNHLRGWDMETRSKWKDALGGQYGCLYIDEINTANIDFVREASMRCDYLMATLKSG